MKFHGPEKKWNFFGTLLCKNVNIILNKNKVFIRKIKENEVGKETKRNFGLTSKCKATLGKDQFRKKLNIWI